LRRFLARPAEGAPRGNRLARMASPVQARTGGWRFERYFRS
jgi:hypothetical protein